MHLIHQPIKHAYQQQAYCVSYHHRQQAVAYGKRHNTVTTWGIPLWLLEADDHDGQ